MRTSGVICEFNPFHSGHAYLLSRMREAVGDDGCVICVMSGRFVQRGTAAIGDPYLRAAMALAGGADLVLELPFPWSAGSAEHFALAGVRILSRLGVDTLAFGSECGDRHILMQATQAVTSPTFGDTYAALCRRGIGTTAAYAEAIRAVAAESDRSLPADFPSSNDLLGIAYLRALTRAAEESPLRTPMNTLVVPRVGSGYREDTWIAGTHPSATALRAILQEAACDPTALAGILEGAMPEPALDALLEAIELGQAPATNDRLLPFYHAHYRLQDPAVLAAYAELGGGLAGHICRCATETATGEAFFSALRTKQYTDARLRRALLFGVLGVTEEDLRAAPTYTTLLGATERGCAFLKACRSKSDLADFIVTKPADAPIGRQQLLGARADSLFTLCLPTPRHAGDLMQRSPTILHAL